MMSKNRGATLLIVIISLSIITVFATLLISSASMTSRMKSLDKQSKQTQYYAEAGIDQIYAKLSVITEAALIEAFDNTSADFTANITSYVGESIDTQEKVNEKFVSEFKIALEDNDDIKKAKENSAKAKEVLNEFIEIMYTAKAKKPEVLELAGAAASYNSMENTYDFTFREVVIEYTNPNTNVRTTIKTDIEIHAPEFDFPLTVTDGKITTYNYGEYVLVAGQDIELSNTTLNATGGIYAGAYAGADALDDKDVTDLSEISGVTSIRNDLENEATGILLNNSNLNINGGNNSSIITPGMIVVKSGSFKANLTNVLCNALITSSKASASNQKVNITGSNVYVADDMELNAASSEIKISGKYYGFNEGNGGVNTSSSININGQNSKLDLSACDELLLAGVSYFNVKKIDNSQAYYQTGSSISLRGDALAYLVKDTLSKEAQEKLINSVGGTVLSIEEYLGMSMYTISPQLSKKIEYFKTYVEKAGKETDYVALPTYMYEGTADGYTGSGIEVKLPTDTSKLLIKGNYIVKDATTGNYSVISNFFNTDIQVKASAARPIYRAGVYTGRLDTAAAYNVDNYNIFERLINEDNLDTWNIYDNMSDGNYITFASDKDITITPTSVTSNGVTVPYANKGMIVTSGKITISGNVNFNGIILAKGGITTNGGTITLTSDLNYRTANAGASAIGTAVNVNSTFKDLILKNDSYTYIEEIDMTNPSYQVADATNVTLRYKELIQFANWSKDKVE